MGRVGGRGCRTRTQEGKVGANLGLRGLGQLLEDIYLVQSVPQRDLTGYKSVSKTVVLLLQT